MKRNKHNLEERIEELNREKKYFEEKADRAKMEASNMRLSTMFNSSSEMHKSFIKEKANELDIYREKATKF